MEQRGKSKRQKAARPRVYWRLGSSQGDQWFPDFDSRYRWRRYRRRIMAKAMPEQK